jgi:hypothetical protein
VTVLSNAGREEMLKRAHVNVKRDPCEPNWSGKVRVKAVLARRPKRRRDGFKRRSGGYGR